MYPDLVFGDPVSPLLFLLVALLRAVSPLSLSLRTQQGKNERTRYGDVKVGGVRLESVISGGSSGPVTNREFKSSLYLMPSSKKKKRNKT